MSKDAFSMIYDVIVGAKVDGTSLDESILAHCIDIAAKNKVLLQFLRASRVHGDIRSREEARYRSFLRGLSAVNEALKGLNHVFIKLRKPVAYVPSDVDVLVSGEDILEAVSSLLERGFSVEVVEPYCVTMVRGSTVVDLYVHPTLAGVIYLDARGLFEHSEPADLGGVEVPVLRTYAEALITVAHAVYKERIYTLNDYVTASRWLDWRSLKLAEDLQCLSAVREALAVHELVEKRKITLPYSIPYPKWASLLGSKVLYDELTRTTLLNVLKALGDKRFGKLFLSKLTRETY